MNGPDPIARLRAAGNAQARVPLGHGQADAALQGGLRLGALHEIFAVPGHEARGHGLCRGAGRAREQAAALDMPGFFRARIRRTCAATGLLEFGLDPSRMFLFRAANAEDAMRAASRCAFLCSTRRNRHRDSGRAENSRSRCEQAADAGRRAKKRHGDFCCVSRPQPDASTAETRWRIRAASTREKLGSIRFSKRTSSATGTGGQGIG